MKILLAFAAGVLMEKFCRDTYDKGFIQMVKVAADLGQGAVEMHKESPVSLFKLK
jgi:hypothetical protein